MPQVDLNIDHHITNTCFARVNLVETDAVATAEVLALRLPQLGYTLPPAAVDALLTGILTDTIGFRTINMQSRALRVAADLMDAGANLSDLYNRALINRSFSAMRYWGSGLTSLKREGRMAWACLTLEDRKTASYSGRDDADLINALSAITDIDVAMIFIEQTDQKVKVSWRAPTGLDISPVALRFGGGGHPAASGAEISGSLDEVCQQVLQVTREHMRIASQKK